MSLRSALYKAARLLGDLNAIRRGRARQRLWNRWIGRAAARGMRKVWR